MFAKDIMTTQVVTINETTTVKEAITLLVEIEISGLIVTRNNTEMVGVITERDLIVALDFIGQINTPVTNYIQKTVVSVSEDTSIEEIAQLLIQGDIRRVPVLRDGHLVGVISRRDILRYYMTHGRKG